MKNVSQSKLRRLRKQHEHHMRCAARLRNHARNSAGSREQSEGMYKAAGEHVLKAGQCSREALEMERRGIKTEIAATLDAEMSRILDKGPHAQA